MIIAIDGPAASGKGTLAKRIARHYNLPHLDTGLTYRAVGHAMLNSGNALDNPQLAEKIARDLDLAGLDETILSAHEIGEAASKIAVMPKVRAALVEAQRNFASSDKGAVLDGRDIGTVVFPQADVKLYVTASAEKRAERRYRDAEKKGAKYTLQQIYDDILQRDERDMSRADSPLRPAEDAHLLDTTEMSIEQAFEAAIAIIDESI